MFGTLYLQMREKKSLKVQWIILYQGKYKDSNGISMEYYNIKKISFNVYMYVAYFFEQFDENFPGYSQKL